MIKDGSKSDETSSGVPGEWWERSHKWERWRMGDLRSTLNKIRGSLPEAQIHMIVVVLIVASIVAKATIQTMKKNGGTIWRSECCGNLWTPRSTRNNHRETVNAGNVHICYRLCKRPGRLKDDGAQLYGWGYHYTRNDPPLFRTCCLAWRVAFAMIGMTVLIRTFWD